MAKVYAEDPVKCIAEGRIVHDLVYMGTKTDAGGVKKRSLEYRCAACGEFVTKSDLQGATQNA